MAEGWGDYLSCFFFSFFSSCVCLLHWVVIFGFWFFFFLFFFPSRSPCSFTLFTIIMLQCKGRGTGGAGFQIFFGGGGENGMRGSVGWQRGNSCLIWEFFFSSFPVPIHLNILYYHTLFCLFFPSILVQFFLFYVCKFGDSEGSFFFFSFFSFFPFFSPQVSVWSGLVGLERKKERGRVTYIILVHLPYL